MGPERAESAILQMFLSVFLYLVAQLSICVGTPFIFLSLFITALSFQLLALLGLLTDEMNVRFPYPFIFTS